jgi:hypothetical protein
MQKENKLVSKRKRKKEKKKKPCELKHGTELITFVSELIVKLGH